MIPYMFGADWITQIMITSDELYVIQTANKKWNISVVQSGPGAISKSVQTGQVPAGRTGHTLNVINNSTLLLHGGLSFDQRDASGVTLGNLFSQTCKDGSFYVLNTDTYHWSKLEKVPDVTSRAYHTATTVQSDGLVKVIFNGGVTYEGRDPSERLPIKEFVILNFRNSVLSDYFVEKVTVPMSNPKYISYHSTVLSNNHLYILGGNVQNERKINEPPQLNSEMKIFDLENKSCDSVSVEPSYIASGHSAFELSSDCIMIVGGINDSMFVYTTKPMKPSPCDFQFDCKIDESPEISPIAWIQCESNCKRWLYQYCVGLLNKRLPKGKYICQQCQDKKSNKRKR